MTTQNDATTKRTGMSAFLIWTSVVAVLATTIPYFIGYLSDTKDRFLWAGTSPSDYAVYLAWMYTAAHGGFREQHLFAGGHPGFLINPVYLLMGLLARVTGMPLFAAYQIGRVAFGCALLYVLWRFIRMTISDDLTRRLSFLFLCFSSGFGWIAGPLFGYTTIDQQQPEAITFLTLYTYPHFCASLALQVAVIGLLYKSEQTRRGSYAAYAGLCYGLLAIEHTYDVITVACIWLTYIIVRIATGISFGPNRVAIPGMLIRGFVALLTSSYGVVYVVMALRYDRVFATRDVSTASHSPAALLFGYGGVLLLAVVGVKTLFTQPKAQIDNNPITSVGASVDSAPGIEHGSGVSRPAAVLFTVWAVVNSAVYYLPVPFQRKLIQGDHVALSLLAAVGAAYLLRKRFPLLSWANLRFPEIVVTLLLAAGSFAYVQRDLDVIASGQQMGILRPYITAGEADALDWVAHNTPASAVIQPIPWMSTNPGPVSPTDMTLALFVPGFTGRAVYAGHWSETPNFEEKIHDAVNIVSPDITEPDRKALEAKCGIDYLIFSQMGDPNVPDNIALRGTLSNEVRTGDLKLAYANSQANVYQIVR